MIYFDNAATSRKKPEGVYDAFNYFVREIGVSPGRGSYSLGIEASRMLFKTRKKVANYFGLIEPNVIFTKNSTEAINLFFHGFLKQGDHVIISCYEHNAVLRPLQKLKEQGLIEYSIIQRQDLELSETEICEKYIKDNTVLFATILASNLTGRIIFSNKLSRAFQEKGIKTFVDSSQGAGKIRLSMPKDGIDYLAFTGHKDLMAFPGVGGLCTKVIPHWSPLLQGGTGILGDSYINPDIFPEGYEAGTLNMPAIWSLNASIDYINENFSEIWDKEKALMNYLVTELCKIDSVEVYDLNYNRVSTIGINIKGFKSNEVVELLDKNNICTRGGIHCAILAHEALETKEKGVVRISLSYINNYDEIDTLIHVIEKCG